MFSEIGDFLVASYSLHDFFFATSSNFEHYWLGKMSEFREFLSNIQSSIKRWNKKIAQQVCKEEISIFEPQSGDEKNFSIFSETSSLLVLCCNLKNQLSNLLRSQKLFAIVVANLAPKSRFFLPKIEKVHSFVAPNGATTLRNHANDLLSGVLFSRVVV